MFSYLSIAKIQRLFETTKYINKKVECLWYFYLLYTGKQGKNLQPLRVTKFSLRGKQKNEIIHFGHLGFRSFFSMITKHNQRMVPMR